MNRKKFLIKYAALAAAAALTVSIAGCAGVDRDAQETYRQQGISLLEQGDYEKAQEQFEKALDEAGGRVGDEEIDISYYKALAQYKSGDTDGAIDTYDGLVAYDKKNPDVYYLRGSLYLKENENSKCISDYNKAAEYADGDYQVYIAIYENLTASGFEENGEKYLEKALDLKASSDEDKGMQGYICYLLGQYDRADELLQEAADGGYSKALIYQAQLYSARGQKDKAQEAYEDYIEENQDNADALNEAGMLEMHAGNYDNALDAFTRAYKTKEGSENRQIRLNMIYACEYSGDFEKAYELMTQYVSDYPDDQEADREYSFLKTRVDQSQTDQQGETESEE